MTGNFTIAVKMCLVAFVLLVVGCAHKTHVMIAEESVALLRRPADFTIKIAGMDVYTSEDKEIPVGQILTDCIKKEFEKREDFSIGKGDSNQYVLGIDIGTYNTKVIGCDVEVFTMTTIDSGEKMIGEKIFTFHVTKAHQAPLTYTSPNGLGFSPLVALVNAAHSLATAPTSWRTIIEDCASDICKSIDNVFPK